MTNIPDWTNAAMLPPGELARALEADRDEVDDNPPLTDAQLADLRPASDSLPPELHAALTKRRPGQRGPGRKPALVLMTIRVEPELLEAYRSTGDGWQSRARAALRDGAPAKA